MQQAIVASASLPLPTQRRSAIHFKYSSDDTLSMRNIGTTLPRVKTEKIESSTYREMYSLPTDSWEIENCVGYAIEHVLRPRWNEIKQLGRCLTIFKVHKDPQVCELFFMPLEEVIQTYSGRFPKNVEWVHLYDPDVEIAFWAELYRPRSGSSTRRSLLTDELCGGSGSRFTVIRDYDDDRMITHLSQAMASREETQERLAEKQAKMEKNRRKKEKQKEKKAEARAALQAEEQRAKQKAEAEELATARAARMPAPALHGIDFKGMLKPKDAKPAVSSGDTPYD